MLATLRTMSHNGFMENAQPSQATRIDILAKLQPEGWMQIAAENLKLNAIGIENDDDSDAEMEVFADVAEIIKEDELIGNNVTVVGFGRTATDETLRLMAVTGHYNAVTSISGGAEEHIEGLSSGDEVLALCVHAAQKKKNSAQDCYFPLNRSTLACVEVELGDDDTPYIVSLLRKRQRMIQDIVASSDFQALNIHKKRKTLDLIAEDLSLEFADSFPAEMTSLVCHRYSEHIKLPEIYSVVGSEYDAEVISGDKIRLIPQERNGELVVELSNSKEQATYLVRVDDVVDMYPRDSHLVELGEPTDEIEITDMIGLICQEADGAEAFVSSPIFRKLSLDIQRKALERYEDAIAEHLSTVTQFLDSVDPLEIEVRVTAFRCQPESTLCLGWSNPLVSQSSFSEDNDVTLTVDFVKVYNPDLADSKDRTEPFTSRDDFTLSGGEPMVLMGIGMTEMYYLVRARDILSLVPVYED